MQKYLKYIDKILILIILSLFLIIRPDFLVIFSIIFFSLYLILTKRKRLFYHLLISFSIALIWMLSAKNYYSYNINMINFFGISIFPLFSWTLGLLGVYLIYSHNIGKFKKVNNIKRIILFSILYWPLLIIIEILGYHIFKISNMTNTYSGLPLCDCMHGPWWLKIAYFLLGIVFFIICIIFKLENPKKRKKLIKSSAATLS